MHGHSDVAIDTLRLKHRGKKAGWQRGAARYVGPGPPLWSGVGLVVVGFAFVVVFGVFVLVVVFLGGLFCCVLCGLFVFVWVGWVLFGVGVVVVVVVGVGVCVWGVLFGFVFGVVGVCGGFRGCVLFVLVGGVEKLGGAVRLLVVGVFERFPLEAFYGLHNWPGVPAGMVVINPVPMMASLDTFE
ncbi:hypothetical protein RA275_27710, partial [Pseudomonas syringae pv. tagetis]